MLNMLTYCFFYKFLLLRAIIQPGCGNYLQEDLDGLHKWSHDWSMDFNRIKYKVTHISKKKISSATNRTIHLTIENLKAFHTNTDPGIIVSNNMSWNRHIEETVMRANRTLGLLKRVCVTPTSGNCYTVH